MKVREVTTTRHYVIEAHNLALLPHTRYLIFGKAPGRPALAGFDTEHEARAMVRKWEAEVTTLLAAIHGGQLTRQEEGR